MQYLTEFRGREQEIVDLFAATFTASDGMAEGELTGGLVRKLMCGTPRKDIHLFTTWDNGLLVAGAVLTRLTFAGDPRTVFLVSPMAVATDRQDEGIGKALLRHALAEMRNEGVDVVMTYGDPAFYGRVGFLPVSEVIVPAPLPLSHPEGWIGQSLTAAELTPLHGPGTCVMALDDARFW